MQASPLSGSDNARDPFFSPDGQWLGFFADGKLKKASVQGGAAITVCEVLSDRGGSWSEDGSIVFAPDNRSALLKVSSAGGTPESLTTLDAQSLEATERWPQMLPGGKAVLFTSNVHGSDYEDADIVLYSIPSKQRKVLLRGAYYGRYVPSDHLVYMHEGTLFAVPFDVNRLEVSGAAAPVLDDILASPAAGVAQFTFSQTGNFAYVTGHSGQTLSLYWMDRLGKFTPLRETPASYRRPAFSPDGKRLAMQIDEGKRSDIWVYEWERDTLTRLTFAGEANLAPAWTPDGQRITYIAVDKRGEYDLYWKRADGAGDALRLTKARLSRAMPHGVQMARF